MKKKFYLKQLLLAVMLVFGVTSAWGEVVSGTTYDTKNTSSLPTGWSGMDGGGTSYIKLTASTHYVQTDKFSAGSITSIKVKARKFGGPSDDQALITVSWYSGSPMTETVLGTIAPTNTTLTDYTISSPAAITAGKGYVEIQCKGASSSKGSGISQVTINYTQPSTGVSDPTFTPEGGTYTGDKSVTISADEGCTIYYTLDGTDPTDASTKYTGAIELTAPCTTTIKAIAYDASNNASNVTTATYTLRRSQYTPAQLLEEVTPDNESYTVVFTDEMITKFYVYNSENRGFYFNTTAGEFLVYCNNTPDSWTVGGTVSGTVTGTWKTYSSLKEFCPTSYDDFVYTAPSSTTYNVTVDPAITHGTVTANPSSDVVAGVEVTLTATPNAHYNLSALTVTRDDNSEVVEVTDNKFTMPASDVTVYASFTENAKYNVAFICLDDELKNVDVYAGETISSFPDVTDAPEGWTFVGWTDHNGYEASTTAPEFFTETTPVTEDLIVYAVFKKTVGGGVETAELTNSDITGSSLTTSYAAFEITNDYGTWSGNGCKQGNISSDGEYFLQLRATSNGSYLKLPEFSGNITSIVLNRVCNASKKQYTGSIYFNAPEYSSSALATGTSSAVLDDVTLTIPDGYKTGYVTVSGACRISSVTVTYESGMTYYTIKDYGKYTREGLTEGGLGTICLTRSAMVEGARVYEISAMTTSGDEISAITFSEIEGAAELGKSYLFKATDATLTATYVSAPVLDPVETSGFVGTFDGCAVPEGKYFILNNEVRKCGAGCTVGANRAYIDPSTYTGTTPAKGDSFTVEFDQSTSINALEGAKVEDGVIYNLAGQRIGKVSSGVVIKNGKKYIVK